MYHCVWRWAFSVPATVALIATAGVLGDAGSPASDSTLGPTMGLNADGQHDHIHDSVIPTFIHYNIPLIVFGWIAAMVLLVFFEYLIFNALKSLQGIFFWLLIFLA